MYDESYGLRFDIYERVHLSDELVGIDQLEEVELTPHIQVLPAGEQVTVRGSLLLSGAYIGTSEDRRSQSLEHWIPVEITLPLNRIRSLDEIRVDIENFDVDLLSTRSLNITGVLSLRGIHVEQPGQSTWEPEQFTVVHEANDFSTEPTWLRDYGELSSHADASLEEKEARLEQHNQVQQADEASANDSAARVDSVQDSPQLEEIEVQAIAENETDPERVSPEQLSTASAVESPKINLISKPEPANISREEETQSGEPISDQLLRQIEERDTSSSRIAIENQADSAASADSPGSTAGTTWTWADSPWGNSSAAQVNKEEAREEPAEELTPASEEDAQVDRAETSDSAWSAEAEPLQQEPAAQDEPAEPAPEKSAMKIAIGSSKSNTTESSSSIGLSSLLRTNYQTKDTEEDKGLNEESAQAEPIREPVSNDTNWQSIFLHRVQDDRSFSKVRMCIVQRDDTLDLIANRYQMNPRDIAAHNRLSEPSVTEGQVLYIPLVVSG